MYCLWEWSALPAVEDGMLGAPKKIHRPERNDGEDLNLTELDRRSAQDMVWQMLAPQRIHFRGCLTYHATIRAPLDCDAQEGRTLLLADSRKRRKGRFSRQRMLMLVMNYPVQGNAQMRVQISLVSPVESD